MAVIDTTDSLKTSQKKYSDRVLEFDSWLFLSKVRSKVSSLILFFFIGSFVCSIFGFFQPDIYTAEVVFVPSDQSDSNSGLRGEFNGLAALAGVELGGADVSKSQIYLSTLESRAFAVEMFDGVDIFAPLMSISDQDQDQEGAYYSNAYNMLQEIRDISIDSKTGVMTLSISWSDSALASQWANAHIDFINRHLQKKALKQSDRMIQYLGEQQRQTNIISMQEMINGLIEHNMQNATLAASTDEFAFSVIDPAIPPIQKSGPSMKLYAVTGGIAFVFLFIFLQLKGCFRVGYL